ncbi:MAG: zeta toxin family protein [bacterium]
MKEIHIIAGPNGSGKTTVGVELIKGYGLPFLNADDIAYELSENGSVEKVRIKAGKIFLKEIKKYAGEGKSFAIETTLAGKYITRVIELLKKSGYKIILNYIFVDNPEIAINRIKIRVRKGGHFISNEDVIRRFSRSKKNFWNIYKKTADNWSLFYNGEDKFIQVATGEGENYKIVDDESFDLFKEDLK